MSTHESNMDLPALSADESGGSMTDNSAQLKELLPSSSQDRSYNTSTLLQQQPQSFIDSNLFYGLDQQAPDRPLFFMQQQQQQQQNLFDNQYMKSNGEGNSNMAQNHGGATQSTSLAQSIASSMESFQAAITNSVGEQPPSFWTGLNNFISNVTHNNIFPTFPNIAKSFSEYIANHPVPFLSSTNADELTASPISSPMPSHMDFDPILQFKKQSEQSNTGLQIRVLGVPQTGAKSRVETQIKLCIQLVTDGGDKAQWWSHLKLPEHMVTKEKLRKPVVRATSKEKPEKMLYLQARVLCASDPSRKVVTCIGCIQRERKRSQRRKENKQQQLEDEAEDDLASDEERVLLFNCAEVVDFSAGDTILPTRITCYCRHHNERVGFYIYFEMLDHVGKKVAEGVSPPIMITDDHKSNKVKAGLKRRRTTESEVLPPQPLLQGRIPALNWIRSFQFGESTSVKVENDNYPPVSSASSTTSADDNNMKFAPMLAQTSHLQQVLLPMPSQSHPVMKRLIPNEAPTSGGIEVTILGTGFRPGLTVLFGDKPATNLQYWSPNTLICILPPATQPGAVVVSFKETQATTNKSDIMVFTYLVETDRALMELALQVVGMKMTGIVEDARKVAMRIVQGNSGNQIFNSDSNSKLVIKSEEQ